MLDIVEVRTSQGALLALPLANDTTGYIVEDIQGLDPVKATLVSSSFANLDGAQYHSSRREPRNLKIRLGMSPDYAKETVAILRDRLYGFFMPKSEVRLRFKTSSGRSYDISGRVEDFVSPLFTADPTVDITLICYNPDFTGSVPRQFDWGTTASQTELLVPYKGTVETGVVFTLLVNRSLAEFTIYHRPPDGTLRTLNFTSPLVANDILTISTVVGAKSVIRRRANVESSLLFAMSPQSNWLEFQPGDNYIRFYAEGAEIPFNIRYTDKYGGL